MCFWVVLRTVETVENPYAKSETLAGGFEPPTFGLGNRCSILLSYANRNVDCIDWICAQVAHPGGCRLS